MKDKDLYYDFAKFEAQMVATRSSFALFFQSMLLGAVASLADKNTFIPIWILMILGLIVSLIIGYLNWITCSASNLSIEKLTQSDPRVEEIFQELNQKHKYYYNSAITKIMVYIFPSLTGSVWLILLAHFFYEKICIL